MEKATVHDWPADGSQGREFSVEDALIYLEKIKTSFTDTPEVYGEFLTIMKNFKSQQIDTQEVIGQIKSLFSGKKDLISEFYQFLPDDVSEEDYEGMKSSNKDATTSEQRNVVSPSAPARLQQAHAMTYVIKVRNRFASQPHVYSSFLQVLNTYHMSQRTIKEVLEVVSQLFADHVDLLTEFAYFLPDAVQEQAKKRMHEAVREAEHRRQQMPAPQPAPSALPQPYLTGVLPIMSPMPVPSMPEPGMFVPTLPEHLLLQSTATATITATTSTMHAMPAGDISALPTPSHLLATTAPPVSLGVQPTSAEPASATATAPTPAPAASTAPTQSELSEAPAVDEAPEAPASGSPGKSGTRGNSGGRKRANSGASTNRNSNKKPNNNSAVASSVSASASAASNAALPFSSLPLPIPYDHALAQSSAAAADVVLQDVERRLGKVEALVELQHKRLDEQAGEIAQMKAVQARK